MLLNSTYEVALSFAGEDRKTAEFVALELARHGVRVFYDEHEQVELWGKELTTYLTHIYSSNTKYCIILISTHYVRKKWTKLELRSAISGAFERDSDYILPVRIDDALLPDIPPTIGYLDLRIIGKDKLVDLILKKLGRPINKHSKKKPVKQYQDNILFWKVRSAVNSLDPIHLFPEAPTDEYDPETKNILKILQKQSLKSI